MNMLDHKLWFYNAKMRDTIAAFLRSLFCLCRYIEQALLQAMIKDKSGSGPSATRHVGHMLYIYLYYII